MRALASTLGGLCALLGLGGLALGSGRQEAPPPAPPTADERIAELERRVEAQELELARLARLASGLLDGTARMAAAVELSRLHGFEQAGANPLARTELLDGLKGLHESLKKAAEPPKPAPTEER